MFGLCLALLIEGMGDDNFRTREAATAALRSMGGVAQPALVKARTHPDPEIRHRARLLTADWYGAFRPTTYPLMPWICRLPDNWPDRDATVARLIGEYDGEWAGLGDWPRYRQATARLVEELVAAGWSRQEVVRLLDGMACREKAEIERMKQNNTCYNLWPLLEDKTPTWDVP